MDLEGHDADAVPPVRPPPQGKPGRITGRAAEVIVHVLLDVGLDRFLAGTVLLDREFRLRFHSMPPGPSPAILASVALGELDAARAFRTHVLAAGLDDEALAAHSRIMAEGIMDALRSQSPGRQAVRAAGRRNAMLAGRGASGAPVSREGPLHERS